MKKCAIFLFPLFLFFLFGCETTTTTTIQENPGITTTTAPTTTTVTQTGMLCKDGEEYSGGVCVAYQGGEIASKGYLAVEDRTTEENLSATTIEIYRNKQKNGIDYVNIEDFLEMLDELLADLTVDKSSVLTITLPIKNGQGQSESVVLVIDPLAETIAYTDFNFTSMLYVGGSDEYDTDLQVVEGFGNPGNVAKVIHLGDYDLDIVLYENDFYFPLSLADLLFTWDGLNVYPYDESLYIFNDVMSIQDVIVNEATDAKDENQDDLIEYTTNFAALFFDHFYGLKDYLGVQSYQAEFESLGLSEATSIDEFDELFQRFVYSADDLHTTIVSYGMNAVRVARMSPLNDSRISRYTQEYLNSEAAIRTEDIKLTEFESYYILEVNSFNLETKDLLAGALPGIDTSKDIIIDLTCNTGGNIIAVVELLTYLTNEPIVLNYKNAATGETFTETYQSRVYRALPNNFLVLTSPVTFSAANLFTSIVKDMGLGLIFGRHNMGGAATVSYTVLPNNLIFSYSTNIVFTDDEGNIIEDGIDPDLESTDGSTNSKLIEDLMTIGSRVIQPDIVDRSTNTSIDVEMTDCTAPSAVVVSKYFVEIYDKSNQRKIIGFSFTSDSFHQTNTLSVVKPLIEVRIVCEFTYHGFTLRQKIFSKTVDDLTSEINPATTMYSPGLTNRVSKIDDADVDFFKIKISYLRLYRIVIEDKFRDFKHELYDESGTLLGIGFEFFLNPGIYYIKIDYSPLYVGLIYFLTVQSYVEGFYGPNELTLDEGLNRYTLVYEYNMDREVLLFTVPKTALIHLTVTDPYYNVYRIGDENLVLINRSSENLSPLTELIILLPKGIYSFESMQQLENTTVICNFSVTFVDSDLSNKFTQENSNYGVLVEGINNINFEGPWDTDVYTVTTETAMDLMITDLGDVKACQLTVDGDVCGSSNHLFALRPGVNYFAFSSFSQQTPPTQRVEVVFLNDQSDSDHKIPLAIGQTLTGYIEEDHDYDYFSFSLDSLDTLKISIPGTSLLTYRIFNGEGEKVLERADSFSIFQLGPGDYVLEITNYNSNQQTVLKYSLLVSHYVTTDADPGVMDLSEASYRAFVFPAEIPPYVTGTIDYRDDQDFFLIRVLETGDYKLSYSSSNSKVNLYDSNGTVKIWSRNTTIHLEAGTYYLNTYSYEDSSNYQWMIITITPPKN